MADTYTPLLRFAMQEPLANVNQWGTIFNAAVFDLIDDALANIVTVDVTGGNVSLQAINGSPDTARAMMLEVVGSPGGVTTVTVPTLSKLYVVINVTAPAQPVNIKTALSSSLQILPSQTPAIVIVDSAANRIRALGRANGVLAAPSWTDIAVTFQNRTAGDTGITIKYAKQGSFATIYIPSFNTTLSTGGIGLSPNPPDLLLGDNGTDQITFPPSFIDGSGVGAGAVPAFFFSASAGTKWGWTNLGIGAVGAGAYVSRGNLTYTYSTRSP